MVTIEQASRYYEGADSVHDFDHVMRVYILAEKLGAAEGADLAVVRQATLLHDACRGNDNNKDSGFVADLPPETDHALLAAHFARQILADEPTDFVEAVTHAIAAHRYRNAITPATIEAKVLFDADKLDAIGAVGVARAFAFVGAYSMPLWGEVSPNYQPGVSGEKHTPNHEYVFKLNKIRDIMTTASGRRMAEERHRFMVQFFERMAAEVRGDF